MAKRFGAIEVGGTKVVCGVGADPLNFDTVARIETRDPDSTMAEVIDFFRTVQSESGPIAGIGVASFGPLNVDPQDTRYGQFFATPKPGWTEYPLRQGLVDALGLPVSVTTDVNGALLAEAVYGAAQGVSNAVYVTVGTGLGAGALVNGQLVSGFMHPEVGHMRVPSHGVEGSCPFHANCLEGLVCGPAIAKRAGKPAEQLATDDPLWDDIAINLADMCVNLLCVLSTERIILGGGVMQAPGLLAKVRTQTETRLAGYLPVNSELGGFDSLIVAPALAELSGLTGALHLIQTAPSNPI